MFTFVLSQICDKPNLAKIYFLWIIASLAKLTKEKGKTNTAGTRVRGRETTDGRTGIDRWAASVSANLYLSIQRALSSSGEERT
jgi:hypothetical protein